MGSAGGSVVGGRIDGSFGVVQTTGSDQFQADDLFRICARIRKLKKSMSIMAVYRSPRTRSAEDPAFMRWPFGMTSKPQEKEQKRRYHKTGKHQ